MGGLTENADGADAPRGSQVKIDDAILKTHLLNDPFKQSYLFSTKFKF